MIYIDIEEYLQKHGSFPKGYKIWGFKSSKGDPDFFSFTYKAKYHSARSKALEAYHKKFKTDKGIIEVSLLSTNKSSS